MSDIAHARSFRAIDVSNLPTSAWDTRAATWWGNTLLILIETTSIAILLATYWYLRRNFDQWPPPRINYTPFRYDYAPDLFWGTLNLILIVGACVPQYICNTAARRLDKPKVIVWLSIMLVLAIVTSIIRFYEFPAMHFKWNENAYGSILWTLLGTHLLYLLGTGAEFFIMLLWVLTHRLDNKHALDITLAGIYWYWAAAVWIILYIVIYVQPRF
jgi:cytochrome c oxidase subunit I+III